MTEMNKKLGTVIVYRLYLISFFISSQLFLCYHLVGHFVGVRF